jgi:hypothetical protein
MKLAAVDWPTVLATLPAWEALSPAARLAFIHADQPSAFAAASRPETRAELEAAGLVAAGGAVSAAPAFAPLRDALWMMSLAPLDFDTFESPLIRYLDATLSREEMVPLMNTAPLRHGWVSGYSVAPVVGTSEWVEDFLALDNPRAVRAWEKARLPAGEPPRLGDPRVVAALRALVRALGETPGGAPLHDLPTLLPGLDDDTRTAVLAAGIRFLLLFAGVRGEEPEAVLGVYPPLEGRLGPPPPPPAPVEAVETFEAPFQLADMTVVLVEAAITPIPIKNDGSVYARAQKTLAARLQPLPEWTLGVLGVGAGYDDDEEDSSVDPVLAERIGHAVSSLVWMGYASTAEDGARFVLSCTAKGKRWLALPEGERLKEVLDPTRGSPQRNPMEPFASAKQVEFFSTRIPFRIPEKTVDLRNALEAAFLALPAGAMVPLRDFVFYHGRAANPFLLFGVEKFRKSVRHARGTPESRVQWEMLWESILMSFLASDLLPFGGARLGHSADGGMCLGLTPPGRYLLGEDTFDYAPAAASEILVQPDFEIVFLAPAPRLEPELARFADRIGSGVGALFRITRASVLRGAEQGISADEMVATLEDVSRTPVPANVARQVRDWIGGTRRVSLRTALLIECPDPETAARVLALTSGKGALVTPTLIRLATHAIERKALIKKLRDKGIFVAV